MKTSSNIKQPASLGLRPSALLLTLLLAALPLGQAAALDPVISKLFRKASSVAQVSPLFGQSVAINEKWVIVGEPGGDGKGRAYVFNAATGAYVRTLQPVGTPLNEGFGQSVAVSGNLALVGAYISEAAFVFDLLTGKQLQILVPSDGEPGDQFGYSVALDGNLALLGMPGPSAGNPTGTALVWSTSSREARTASLLAVLASLSAALGLDDTEGPPPSAEAFLSATRRARASTCSRCPGSARSCG